MDEITEGQRIQFFRFVEDAARRALKEAGLDKNRIQRLLENGDEFQSRIMKAIDALSVNNRYADEERKSAHTYSSNYEIKSIAEQVNILHQFFPDIGSADEELAKGMVPPNAEGWFAIPRWDKIASTYGKAVQVLFNEIRQTRKSSLYSIYNEEQLYSQHHLRQSKKSIKAFQKLCDEQKNHDILIVPAQFGLRHRGCSVRRAREIMGSDEFGLGAFAVGIMILTHPERLINCDDLWIDFAGDELAHNDADNFSQSPGFMLCGNVIWFGARSIGEASDKFGSASGFLQ